MPTYQYTCTECEQDLEAVQKFSDEPLTECPACNGRLRKVFSAVGVVFKGSGFYRTDSRGKSSASESGSEPKSSSKAAGGESSSTPKADSGSSTKADSGSSKKNGGESAA